MKMISLHKGKLMYGLLALMLSSFAIWHDATGQDFIVATVGPRAYNECCNAKNPNNLQSKVYNYLIGGKTKRLANIGVNPIKGFSYNTMTYTAATPAHISLLSGAIGIAPATVNNLKNRLKQPDIRDFRGRFKYRKFTFRKLEAFWPAGGTRVWIVARTPSTAPKGFFLLVQALGATAGVPLPPFKAHISLAHIDGPWTQTQFNNFKGLLGGFKSRKLPQGIFKISNIKLSPPKPAAPIQLWP